MSEPRNSPETRARISATVSELHKDPEYHAKNVASRAKATEAARVANAGRKQRIAELEAENAQLRAEIARLRGGTQ